MPEDKPSPPAGVPGSPAAGAPPAGASDGIAAGTPGQKPNASVPQGAISAEPMAVPPIALTPSAATKTGTAPTIPPPTRKEEPKDTFRELIETIVFVVVLVLMLKTFLAEAFVIPTGSMADTLLGYHYKITCPQCGYRNLVNASSEADPQGGSIADVISNDCQNCGFTIDRR